MKKHLLIAACLLGIGGTLQAMAEDVETTFPQEGKYYRIKVSKSGVNLPMLAVNPSDSYKLTGESADATSNPFQIWTFKADPNDTETYAMLSNGRYVNNIPTGKTGHPETSETETYYINISLYSSNPDLYSIYFGKDKSSGTNGHCICFNDGGNILNWGPATAGSQWMFEEATEISLTIGATGYASINYGFPVQLPDALKAYTVGNESDTEITLKEVSGNIIPKNTPVILISDEACLAQQAKNYDLTILSDAEAAEANVSSTLEGTLFAKAVTPGEGETIYALAANEGGACFRQLDATNNTVAANKAFYRSTGTANAAATKAFAFDTPTGIETVAAGQAETIYYDLNGRRAIYPAKGIYVTSEGRKVFIK